MCSHTQSSVHWDIVVVDMLGCASGYVRYWGWPDLLDLYHSLLLTGQLRRCPCFILVIYLEFAWFVAFCCEVGSHRWIMEHTVDTARLGGTTMNLLVRNPGVTCGQLVDADCLAGVGFGGCGHFC